MKEEKKGEKGGVEGGGFIHGLWREKKNPTLDLSFGLEGTVLCSECMTV